MLTKKCLKTKYRKVKERGSLVQGRIQDFWIGGSTLKRGFDLRHLTILPTFSQIKIRNAFLQDQ